MKKQLSILLSAMMLIGLVSCGKTEKDPSLEGTWNVQTLVYNTTKNYSDGDVKSSEQTDDYTSEEAKAAGKKMMIEITENTFTVIETSVDSEGSPRTSCLGPYVYTLDGMTGYAWIYEDEKMDILISKLTTTDFELTLTDEYEDKNVYKEGKTVSRIARDEFHVTAVRVK